MLYLSRIFSVLVYPNQNQKIVNRAYVAHCFAYKFVYVFLLFLALFSEILLFYQISKDLVIQKNRPVYFGEFFFNFFVHWPLLA